MSLKKILHLTDLHILPNIGETLLGVDTTYYFERTLQHAHQQYDSFDLILLTGDLAQEPCQASYQRIASHIKNMLTPCICLPGNHDDFTLMSEIFSEAPLNCAKQTTLGNWRIICLNSQKLNSPAGRLDESELLYLQQSLKDYPDSPTLLAVHHPCVASGSMWLDTMQIENSEELLAIVKASDQIKGIVCGHLHQELETQIGHTTRLYVTPATCFQFTPNSDTFDLDTLSPGYRVFELYDNGDLRSYCHRIPEKLTTLDRRTTNY